MTDPRYPDGVTAADIDHIGEPFGYVPEEDYDYYENHDVEEVNK